MLCPVYGHELTPLSCPPHQGVSFRSFKGLIILSPYNAALSVIMALPGCSHWNAVFFARMGLFFRRGTA